MADDAHRGDHLVDAVVVDVAIVHRHGEPLVLDQHAVDTVQSLVQRSDGALQKIDGLEPGLVLVVGAVRGHQFEAVAAGVPQSGHSDALPDVGQAAAADHGDGAVCSQLGQCLVRAGQQRCGVRIGDDVGNRSVEVQEHHRSASFGQRCDVGVGLEGVRQVRYPLMAVAHRQGHQITDHDVGAAAAQFVGVAVTVHSDDQTEATVASSGDARRGVVDDDAASRTDRQTVSRVVQDALQGAGPGGRPCQRFPRGRSVHADREQIRESGGVEDAGAVAARGEHGRGDAGCLQLVHEFDRRLEHAHPVGEHVRAQLRRPVHQRPHGPLDVITGTTGR